MAAQFVCETYPTAAEAAEAIASSLEDDFRFADWNDLGEVTVHYGDRVFRLTVHDITDKMPSENETAARDDGLEVRHDLYGFYVCDTEEGEHEDEGNASVGFDGRPHYATKAEAWEAAALTAEVSPSETEAVPQPGDDDPDYDSQGNLLPGVDH